MGYCDWGFTFEALKTYHDSEWGVPIHDDQVMFEHLMLEVMQCGLSWSLMLKKREVFRRCFDCFDFERIAAYDEKDVERILNTEGMIRSRGKIDAVIHNARCYQEIRREYGSFCDWLWAHSGGKTILYDGHEDGNVPVSNGLSVQIAGELKKYGFLYVGPVTMYSHLQACGIINDHASDCPCRYRIIAGFPTVHMQRDQEKF